MRKPAVTADADATPPRSVLARNKVVEEYAWLVNKVAYQMKGRLPPNVELDDLKSSGVIGLIDVAERFDPNRASGFRAFAEIRIRGAMYDDLRRLDWVPRGVRQKATAIAACRSRLAAELGRPATDGEMAHGLGLSLDDFDELARKARAHSMVGFDDLGRGDGQRDALAILPDPGAPDPEDVHRMHDRRERVLRAFHQLGERERLVMSLYVYEELTLGQIGQIIGVTESRISQVKKDAMKRLQPILEGLFADERPAADDEEVTPQDD